MIYLIYQIDLIDPIYLIKMSNQSIYLSNLTQWNLIYLSTCLVVYFLPIYLSIYPSIFLSIDTSIHRSIYPSICLSVCLSIVIFISNKMCMLFLFSFVLSYLLYPSYTIDLPMHLLCLCCLSSLSILSLCSISQISNHFVLLCSLFILYI